MNGELVVPRDTTSRWATIVTTRPTAAIWGLVPRENIIGKPAMIWWSYDAPTEHLADNNVNLDHLKDMALHFFTKTRWDRSFRLLRGYPLE